MKIQVLSDLHTEFEYYKIKVDKQADVLVLAGDIVCADNILTLKTIAEHVAPIPTIYIAGNHEFYCHDPFITKPKIIQSIKKISDEYDHFHFLDDDMVVIDGVRFIGSTLWSDFNLNDDPYHFAKLVNRSIGDFMLIHSSDMVRFTGDDCMQHCKRAKEYISYMLKQPFDGKTVVVTHFCCHPKSIHEHYHGSSLNPYFTTDCSEFIGPPIDLFIHGHTHCSMDYVHNGVRVFCNPKGYYTENKQFKGKALVEI